MTHVIQHDYGKSKVTLRQIRAAIKAVNAMKEKSAAEAPKRSTKGIRSKTASGSTARS